MSEAINIDKTVEKLLKNYSEHCAKVLQKERKRIDKTKYANDSERELDERLYKEAVKSHEFLQRVIENPIKYLYTPQNMFYTVLDDGKSVYNMLAGIMRNPFDKGSRLLGSLSETLSAVSSYINRNNPQKAWMYIPENRDYYSESVLKLNKIVALWRANDFVRTFKGILPEKHFAVPMWGKEK